MGLFVRLRCVVTANKIKLLFVLAGLPLAAVCHAQRAEQIEDWHNLPILAARTGQAHAWTREFDALAGVITSGPEVLLFQPNNLIALDSATGKTLWSREALGKGPYFRDPFSLRTIRLEDMIVVYTNIQSEATFFALDSKTGELRWTFKTPDYVDFVHAVGSDIVVEGLLRAKRPVSETETIFVLDGKTGSEKCRLSLHDERANREELRSSCPALVDQYILFGDAVTRNGIVLVPHNHYSLVPESWIVGEYLYTHSEVEDFPMDLGAASGLSEFQKFALEDLGKPDVADLWKGRGQGRNYKIADCVNFGGLVGPYHDSLLVTLNSKRNFRDHIDLFTSLVTLPKSGPFVAQLISTPFRVSGGRRICRTSLGYLFHASDDYMQVEAGIRMLLLTDSGPVIQPSPPALNKSFTGWADGIPSRDGIVYFAYSPLTDKIYKQRIHMEPYVVR